MKAKERLDQLLVTKQLFPSRESARTAIMDGGIIVNGEKLTKPGQAVNVEANIEVVSSYNRCPYVSRGGLKLEKALQTFAIKTDGRICIDAGASTGGFTDCLLQNGAAFIYAIDVGYGQLDWSLRSNEKVHTLERTNIRFLTAEKLYGESADKATLAVADLSFISVTKVLEAVINLLDEKERELIILVKPQFEAGREKVGKGGVVREASTHVEVLSTVIEFAQNLNLNLAVHGLTYSPVKGPSGNIEYLLWLKNEAGQDKTISPEAIVSEAFAKL